MGFFSGVFDWFIGIGIGVLTFVGVPITPMPTCTIDLSADRLVWSAEEASDVTITAQTNSPAVAGASQDVPDAKPFSGDLNQLFAQNPGPILNELRNNGIPNASFDPNSGSFIDGFNQTQVTADRICEVYFSGSHNTGYGTKKYKTPKNNTILTYTGSTWTQSSADNFPDKGRHIARGPGFSCGRDVTIPPLSGTHNFSPTLPVGTHTYRLIAQGPGGTKTCEASVTVTADQAPDTDTGEDSGSGQGGEGSETEDTAPQCSDGVDNDGDGDIDYPDDLGCTSVEDTTEAPNPQCADGIDNNGDGLVDYPEDPSCTSERGAIESPIPDANLSLVAVSSLVQQGSTATLNWTAENVDDGSCVLSGSNGSSVSLSGGSGSIETVALENETDFTLRCTDLRDEEVSVGVTIKIVPSFQEI